jgi:xanthine dehydrogenase accessory factor
MKLWKFIHTKLNQDKTVYLMTVIQHKGSSPGRQGFKMVVTDDNEIYGSIGGGVMEFNLVELCKTLLQETTPKPFIKHQIHKGTIVDGSGMICSGEQTVVFYPLNKSQLPEIEEILKASNNNKSGVLSITPTNFIFSIESELNSKYNYAHINETNWSYAEFLNKKDIVYIVGGGHVGLATSKLLKQLGFYVVVFDNRTQLNTFEENIYADEKHLIDYKEVSESIPESNSAYVMIMTNKYTDDKLVLSKLIGKKYKFIGVLGSKAKLKLMFEVLQKDGVTQNELNKVYAPIGLHIYSQTPEEIAVSIAAQIIGIKNKK